MYMCPHLMHVVENKDDVSSSKEMSMRMYVYLHLHKYMYMGGVDTHMSLDTCTHTHSM